MHSATYTDLEETNWEMSVYPFRKFFKETGRGSMIASYFSVF